ncbi:MAG: alpha/beta fold hydrolase [Eubacteriales bacterium]|nr:alpha/beta fold hydrolase [Eubacteriales bacterium]
MNKWQKLGLAVGMGTAVAGTIYVINKLVFKTATSKNCTYKGEADYYKWKFGNISYAVYGEGSPLLLIHDMNCSSSSYEWSNSIEYLSQNHKVYAIDLLGCGHSDKPKITYTTYMYTQLISDFITNIIKCKTDVIATGASSSIVMMAALNNNNIFNRIILVSPESINEAQKIPTKICNIRRLILSAPLIGTMIYNISVNKFRISGILEKDVFSNGIVPSDFVDAYYENAHLSGSSSKFLFLSTECRYTTATISKAVSSLDNCIYIINGAEDKTSSVEEYVSLNSAIETITINDAKKLPQVEQPKEFTKQAEIFLT